VLRAALRRLAFLLAALVGGTALLSVPIGLLGGASLSRSLSLGFYLVGCFLLVAAFFVGNRGPVRQKGPGAPLFGSRFMRWATPLEREETLNESALYLVLGIVLILLGVATDTRVCLL
jgi:hypothetical protein